MGLSLPELPTTFPARYLQVFSLFPSGWHLQEFLETHLKDREPSPACRELATLVGSNGLTNLVLTVNFCDEIPDAVRERGLEPWVLDHPDEIRQRLVLSLPQLQIVKLHGDYRHFDSCNLEAELKRRARQVRNKVLDVLAERTMLVLGYSGWKGDAFLSALRHHLTRRTTFPGSIWWFCYSDDDYQRLPRWLVNSPYVRMVTPSASNRNVLDGREVLSSLRTEMERFREETPVTVPAPARPYEVRFAGLCLWQPRENRDRVLRQAYYVTVESNPALGLSLAQERQRLLGASAGKTVHFLEACYGEAYSLRQLGRSEEALEQFRSVAEQASFDEPLLRGRYAHARNGEGVTLADLGRHEEALAVWSGVVDLPASDDPQVRQARDFAVNNVWLTQWRLGLAEEMDTFALLLRQLSASNDPLVLSLLGRAVEVRLAALHAAGGGTKLNVIDEVIKAVERQIRIGIPEEEHHRAIAAVVARLSRNKGGQIDSRQDAVFVPVLRVPAAGDNAEKIGEPTFKGGEARRPGRAGEALVVLELLRRAVEARSAELREAKPVRQQDVPRTGSVLYERAAFGGDELLNPYPAAAVDETRAKRGDMKIDVIFKDRVKGPERELLIGIQNPVLCVPATGDTLLNHGGNQLTAYASPTISMANFRRTPGMSSNHGRRRWSSHTRMASSRSRGTPQMLARAAA